MNLDTKRTITEVITLYELEPSLRAVYVEGRSDKVLINYYLKKSSIEDVIVYEIDNSIDFSDCHEKNTSLKRNNKNKLLYFAEQLAVNFSSTLTGVICIIDKDFDDLLNKRTQNYYINYTDFNSIELYLFNEQCIDKFFAISLHEFPISSSQTIRELSRVLVDLFFLRYILRNQDIEVLHTNIFEKLITIEKNGLINLDLNTYLERLLHKYNKASEKKVIYEQYLSVKDITITEVKDFIRGHDFIYVFFLFVDKIKNNIKFNLETFERSLFLCLEHYDYSNYSLFQNIERKFKSISTT